MSNSIRKQSQCKPDEESHLQLVPFGGVPIYCLYAICQLKSELIVVLIFKVIHLNSVDYIISVGSGKG
jgi:hypothetical protein